MNYVVWYMRPEFFRDGLLGFHVLKERNKLPNPKDLSKTHIELITLEDYHDEEAVYMNMQGEVWSPNGEQRELIKSKGLAHTSMSVGDVIVRSDGTTFLVDNLGFVALENRDAQASS